jgi:hypothetical protein
MRRADELVEAREAAEAAVSGMVDGTLKVAAFQTILEHLLQKENPRVAEPISGSARPRKKPSGGSPSGTTGRILSLIDEGLFNQQRSLTEIRQILAERGWHYSLEDLGTPFTRLVRRKQLRRTKITDGGKKIWKYSNY